MKLLPFARSKPEEKALASVAPDATDTDSLTWLREIFGVRRGYAGVSVTPENVHKCPPAYAAIAAISQAVAQLPLHVHARTDDGGKDRVTDHPVAALLGDQPNEWTDAYSFRASMTSAALRYDQGAFAYINRVAGRIEELVQIPSSSVTVETDPLTREPRYRMTEASGRVRVLDRTDVLHIRAMDGVAPFTSAREAIAVAMVMERHAAKLFAKGGRPSGALTLPKGLSPDAMKRAMASWNKAHSGEDGGGGTAFLEADMTFTPMQFSSVDSQFLELRAQQVVEIARPFRVPPTMLQDFGRATWANAEESNRQFVTLGLLPWLRIWEGAIRRSLLTADERPVLTVDFVVDDLVRADLSARMEAYSKAIASRILLPNEIRAMENRAPLPGGNEFPPIAGAAPSATGATE